MVPLRFSIGFTGLLILTAAQTDQDRCYASKHTGPAVPCYTLGFLKHPAPLGSPVNTTSDDACAQLCGPDKQCKSYSWDTANNACVLYAKPLRQMGFHRTSSGTTRMTSRKCYRLASSESVVNPEFHGQDPWKASDTVTFGEDAAYIEAVTNDPDGTVIEFSIGQDYIFLCPNKPWKLVFTGHKTGGWGQTSYLAIEARPYFNDGPGVRYDVSQETVDGGPSDLTGSTPSFTATHYQPWSVSISGRLTLDEPGEIELTLNSLEIVPDTSDS